MSIGSPSVNSVNNLIFGVGYNNIECVNDEDTVEDEPDVDLQPSVSTSTHINSGQATSWKRESMYVTLFECECLFWLSGRALKRHRG
jgi:hypothetical protein